MILSKILYNSFLKTYKTGILITALWSKKSRLWLHGRKNWNENLKLLIKDIDRNIWIHCSSLGEFEQALPVITQLKKNFPTYKIIVSFFSPSGYEIQKSNPLIDIVCYLPLDSKKNASNFIDIINPQIILFIKYEFWFYYLSEAKNRNIPILLVSGIFRNNQPFFKWYGNFYKEILKCFTYFFIQDKNSSDLLKSIGFNNHEINGDTRFERVIEIANSAKQIYWAKDFTENKFCLVAGSTWVSDDVMLSKFLSNHVNIKCIVAPHNVNEKNIQSCLNLYSNSILLSEIKNKDVSSFQTIIINQIGLLSSLYQYANICFIGGGFDKSNGVHNTIEAAVYSKPILFGPYYSKYKEAVDLVKENAAISVKSYNDFEKELKNLISNTVLQKEMGNNAGKYVTENKGATQKIILYIQENLLLTN
jgi:3-deoxy-D-manno-octulosonic-acid transferase